jgi:hypothetical protein
MGIFTTYVIYKTGKRRQRRRTEREAMLEEWQAARPKQSSPVQDTIDRVLAERQRERDEDPVRRTINETLARKKQK